MLRSAVAVVAGFLVIGALASGSDALLRALRPDVFNAAGRVDAVGILLFMQLYVALFAVTGCYLAARLAPARPMLHALVLGVLGLLFNVAGTIAMWNTAPVWYHATALVLVMPYAWLGGRIRERELARAGEPSTAVVVA